MVYQPQTHARPHEPSQREIEASDAEVQRFLDDPEAADVDWETYAAGYKWGPDFMRYFNEALAANGGAPLEPEKELLLTSVRGQGRPGGADMSSAGGNKGGVRFAGGLDAILPVSDEKVIHSIRDT